MINRGVRPHVDAYDLGDGRTLLLLAEGRVVNLVAAEGHPPEVMDLAFGIEALALAWLATNGGKLPVGVHEVPADIDAEAARLVLATMGTSIDVLTDIGAEARLPGVWPDRLVKPSARLPNAGQAGLAHRVLVVRRTCSWPPWPYRGAARHRAWPMGGWTSPPIEWSRAQ